MIVNLAYAQTSQASGGQGFIIQLLPLILIFVVFYFLLIRPQQKRVKQHKEMVSSLKVGNQIITSGGMLAKIVKVDDDNIVTISISDGVNVKVKRETISEVLADSPVNK
ncbi:MAG: hypothetical protein CFH34_01531 [Alphaproteobacteria bacterium MarineAlpha9_Bin4]|nr:preprotein translocase subunit YajC [Pelagibacterales bacterium]PPR25233.1 MAG: hypothetical protein CFH34_01531 [Alphaproteobacteria bacterium MarineAlpha9_Bin4]|tara:strand:- start:1397 stop:1723 length:327 start_codon:yes stop_codon:yes gene_type:complete